MKSQLIASAAAVALFAVAGAAQAQTIGHVGADYSRVELDAGPLGDTDADAFQLEGAVRFDAGSLGAMVDGSVSNLDAEGDDATVWSATGHLNTKVGDGLVGGFAGFSASDDVSLWAVGAEAQYAVAPSTNLYGQVGYGQADDLGDLDFWAVRGEVRHFIGDNVKLHAGAGFTEADANGGDFDIWNVGAGAEYQFAGTPWSLTGAYEHGEIDKVDLKSDTFRIGVRYTFGGSLRDRDNAGASLGSAANLFGGGLGRNLGGAF